MLEGPKGITNDCSIVSIQINLDRFAQRTETRVGQVEVETNGDVEAWTHRIEISAPSADYRKIFLLYVNLHELSGSGRYACTRFIWNVPRKQLPEYVISGPSGVATSPFKCRQAAARFNGANHETREMTGSKKLNCQPKSKWHSNGFFPPGMFSNHIFPGSWIMFTLGNLSRNSFLFLKHDPFKSTGTSSQIISFSKMKII